MNEHVHAEIIKEKVDNMDLVVFYRDTYHKENGWYETSTLPLQEEFDYFLCIPQHKETCLLWLNGSNMQGKCITSSVWFNLESPDLILWDKNIIFMLETFEIRTKPGSNPITQPVWAKWDVGTTVTKIKGSNWTGKIVGYYSTELTPCGYAVESSTEKGSVQIYPEAALKNLSTK